MGLDEGIITRAAACKILEQAVEQSDVRAGTDRQMKVGTIGGRGFAWVDSDEPGASLLPRGLNALEEDWMAPGEIAPNHDYEIGFFEVLIASRNCIAAEGALVTGNRRGHTEPRIRVNIRRADKALHQLVCDVIILGQDLP